MTVRSPQLQPLCAMPMRYSSQLGRACRSTRACRTTGLLPVLITAAHSASTFSIAEAWATAYPSLAARNLMYADIASSAFFDSDPATAWAWYADWCARIQRCHAR